MSLTITHTKTNTIPDWDQQKLDAAISAGLYPQGTLLADIVLPSDWNHSHEIADLAGGIAGTTHAATSKTTPVDADELPLVDSAASNVLKKLTWSNLKATLKTYFDTLYGGPLFTYASGYYYCGQQQNAADNTLTPGYTGMYGFYFVVSKATTFDRICLEVTAAVASSTVRLGIYSTVNNAPSTLVLDAGTIDSSSTGTKEIAISQTLPAGVYILAAVCQGGGASATVRSRLSATGPIIAPAASSGTGTYCSFTVAGAITGALASTYTWTSTIQSNTPKIMLRAA